MVALGVSTKGGNTVFAKNSDRPHDEPQPLIQIEAADYSGGFSGTQFVDVPQAAHTYRHVGSKPYWCAGYEHGYNEHQVVIGNEALPSLLLEASEPKLVGMEVLRLGLERSKSGEEAVDVITGLVSEFGQGKFSNSAGVRTYDNIFLIADPTSAYVVECVGHDWAVKKVENVTSISNISQIGEDADRMSPGVKSQATKLGLFEMEFGDKFAFSSVFADSENSLSGLARQCRSDAMLGRDAGQLDVRSMIEVLTDHSDGENPDEDRVVDVAGNLSICLHRTVGESTGASTASLVADLCATDERLPIYWTGLYSPCMTVFLPNFIESELPGVLGIGSELESADSPWWDFYRLTQHGVKAGAEVRSEIRSELSNLQNDLFKSAYEVAKNGRELIGNGAGDAAAEMLMKYMAENAQRVISKVKSMVPGTASVS
jgi:secernin|tara:strand:- start:1864 stop:3150 length:1287 start_codon:yes stop_codon:yes gene_type:complete